MKKIELNGAWQMRFADTNEWLPAHVPGSVYSDLLSNGEIPDPYYRDNEDAVLKLMDHDFIYRRTFELTAEDLAGDALILHCEGLDTLAGIQINGQPVGQADNMHRTWDFDVRKCVRAGENEIEIRFASPTRYIKEAYAACEIHGSTDAMLGFPHLRKAHCMFGWDWGPRLPDAGIWRDICLLRVDRARLQSVQIHQHHADGRVNLSFKPETVRFASEVSLNLKVRVTAPDGAVLESDGGDILIENPQLWWPNGYGDQPLYQVDADLICEGKILDTWHARIGLRTLTMHIEKDAWGESFTTRVNGVDIFTMGGDYIPEDNLRCRITPERTRRLLEDCRLANHNAIRVWGGGYYPDDWFYDACDELGIIVWQDFMFACATYELTPDFAQNIRHEVIDNVRRLRHHASLGLWCGNNEMEWQTDDRTYKSTYKQRADYIRMFEYLIPQALREVDPDTFYWPASPSSGGGFDAPNDPNRGDVHYWDVWHQDKPFTEYRKFFFRYASEFGFQSFPCLKTVETFTEPGDRNVFSYIMEKHQRNQSANGKIMNYLSQTFRYPRDFDHLLYASQLLQAEAIRYGVEHWRRHRGRCMGAIYWQVNDCWPVASWSSIDYAGRWKALHYASKRFFAPVLLSCCEEGTLTQETNVNAEGLNIVKSARLNVSNETFEAGSFTVRWALRDARARALMQGEDTVEVPALSAKWLEEHVFPDASLHDHYFSYELWQDGKCLSEGTALFCAPKHFNFEDPHLTLTRDGDCITVHAEAYARSVEIECDDGDLLLSDNYFDMNAGTRAVRILRGHGSKLRVRSVFDIG